MGIVCVRPLSSWYKRSMFPQYFFPYEWFIPILFVYFFPTYIAFALGHVDARGVFFINLMLGWTIFGWFFALIWALDPNRKG